MRARFDRNKLIRWVVSSAITIIFLVYLYNNHHRLVGSLEHIKPIYLLLVLLGQVVGQVSNSGILRATLRPLDIHMNRFEAFKLTIVSSFVNFFAPLLGGASTRAVYMKSRYGLPYTSLISTLYANYAVMFCVSFTFGLGGVLLIPGAILSSVGVVLALFFAGGMVGSLLFILTGHKIVGLIKKVKFKRKILKSLIDKIVLVDEGWGSIRKDKTAIIEISLWSILANASLILVYWSATASLAINTSFGAYMIFAALASVSLLLNFTPGNVGIREGLYASIYKITGIGLQRVIAFSLIDRAGQIVVIALGWIFFGQQVLKDSRSKEKIELSASAADTHVN